MCHELDETSVDQDSSTDRVENTVHDQSRLRLGRECCPDAESDGNGNWSRDAVAKAEQVRCPALASRPWDLSETSAQAETFECLVEDEDDVECDEFITGDSEGKTDEDGVEDNTELEDEDGSKLSSVGLWDKALDFPVRAKS